MISYSKDSKTIVEASLSTNVTGKLTYVLQFSGSQKKSSVIDPSVIGNKFDVKLQIISIPGERT